jgi:hypothetical protein
MKVKFLNATSIFLAHPLEPCIKIRRVLLNFDQIMGIEKLKKALDFSKINF